MRCAVENLSEAEITELIARNVTEFVIHNSYDMIKRLSLHLSVAMCLKTCNLSTCLDMECILESEENNFSLLKTMNLFILQKLRMICGEVVKPRTLMNLRSIHVEACSSLKCLFQKQLMLERKSLEEITIVHCLGMEEIIEGERNTNAEDSGHAAKLMLPKLQSLKLLYLRNLKRIYNGHIQCDSLRTFEVCDCIALTKLPLGLFGVETGQQMSPSSALEQIRCDEQWWESLQWDQPQAKHLLQPCFVNPHSSRDRFAPSNSNTA
ncbi:disease resistance protein RPS2-like [Neltuma alba]|uniref:disease resistance protein RPS2-like n=1 Tax=Neltuma alba TaxID=207710 RepID=UPI0010A55E32|nr:disease resistance protein RPS2-like [Prosopis alba]